MQSRIRLSALVVAACLALDGCAGASTERSCRDLEVEEFDDQSLVHVVSDDGIEYLTDPPTSGPHVGGGLPEESIATAPLSRPVQVGLLEQGSVLIQYRDVDPAELDELRALAGPSVVLAPNPDLADRVVATAWLRKLRCRDVDTDALAKFAADFSLPPPPEHD